MTVSGVWPVPGWVRIVSAAPDSSEARSIPSSAQPQPGRVLRRPGAGQPPSEAINLQSTESLRPSPPLHQDCGANVQANVCPYLDFNKSANYFITRSPHRMLEKAGWAELRGARRTMHRDLPEQNSIHITHQPAETEATLLRVCPSFISVNKD